MGIFDICSWVLNLHIDPILWERHSTFFLICIIFQQLWWREIPELGRDRGVPAIEVLVLVYFLKRFVTALESSSQENIFQKHLRLAICDLYWTLNLRSLVILVVLFILVDVIVESHKVVEVKGGRA